MSATDKTVPKQLTPWKPGQSGNPAGRPKGMKNQITEKFLQDFFEAWAVLGRPALMTMACTDPSAFVKVAAGLVPKEAEITLRKIAAEHMSDDELADIAAGSGDDAAQTPIDPSQLN